MNTKGLTPTQIIELMAGHLRALSFTEKGYPKNGDNESRARTLLVALDLLEENPISLWVPYKPGDKVPSDGISFYWVMLRQDAKLHYTAPSRPVIAIREYESGLTYVFYNIGMGGIDDLVTHYIPIATPEPPK